LVVPLGLSPRRSLTDCQLGTGEAVETPVNRVVQAKDADKLFADCGTTPFTLPGRVHRVPSFWHTHPDCRLRSWLCGR